MSIYLYQRKNGCEPRWFFRVTLDPTYDYRLQRVLRFFIKKDRLSSKMTAVRVAAFYFTLEIAYGRGFPIRP